MNENIIIDKLQQILHDKLLMSSIKTVVDQSIEKHKPIPNEMTDNSLLGEQYRAYQKGKEMVESAFNDLFSYKKNQKDKTDFNKSR